MRKFLSFFVAFLSLPAVAQTASVAVPKDSSRPVVASQRPETVPSAEIRPLFGYLSYDSVLHAMPDYAVTMHNLEELKAKYDAETKRVEDDFNSKYEEFLEGQREFPQTILQKRQSELQELLDKNILFKDECKRLLESAEKEALAPLHNHLSAVLEAIGKERGYLFILNTDNNACPFVSPSSGENIASEVLERLK